nr:PhzF family phenazine biosynthesis protein [Paracoccus litorisediminis]
MHIFTPRSELPFAGHPTLGSAFALLKAGMVTPTNGRIVQECEGGPAEIEVRSFAPSCGVNEDPFCGSGNGAVAAYRLRGGDRPRACLCRNARGAGRSLRCHSGPRAGRRADHDQRGLRHHRQRRAKRIATQVSRARVLRHPRRPERHRAIARPEARLCAKQCRVPTALQP